MDIYSNICFGYYYYCCWLDFPAKEDSMEFDKGLLEIPSEFFLFFSPLTIELANYSNTLCAVRGDGWTGRVAVTITGVAVAAIDSDLFS